MYYLQIHNGENGALPEDRQALLHEILPWRPSEGIRLSGERNTQLPAIRHTVRSHTIRDDIAERLLRGRAHPPTTYSFHAFIEEAY